MAYTGDGTRLVGDDGSLTRIAFGAEVVGDAVTPLPVGFYLVCAVAGSSGLPATALGGTAIAAGDTITVQTGITITPAVGDDLVTLTPTAVCDVTSFTFPFSRESIDVTNLCDVIKKYRAGKADMDGSMTGNFVVGTTDSTSGLIRPFIRMGKQDGSTSFDSFAQEDSVYLGFFYLIDDTNVSDIEVVIAPFQLYGHQLGGQMGNAQAFDASLKFASLSYTHTSHGAIEINPTLYRWAA
jgi:hypothetical protein